jgi:MarR family 2-MHQ and catechol resistance regulon transcriptional repressor
LRAQPFLGTLLPVGPDLDTDELTTMGLFFETHTGLTRELGRRLERDSNLSVQWFEVLLRLVRTPGHRLRMSDLAAQTTLTASGLTRVIDRLDDAGLATRETCPEDRRVAYAVLTPEGEARMATALPMHLRHVQELVTEVLPADELAAFGATLRKLRDVLNPGAAAASDCPSVADLELLPSPEETS